MSQVGIRG